MLLHGSGGVSALAAYRGKHFQGYAVRTVEGWVCIASIGMSWTKLRCRTVDDARVTLRTTSHAGRFESFDDVEQLQSLLEYLPEYERPYITPDQIPGVALKLRLKPVG